MSPSWVRSKSQIGADVDRPLISRPETSMHTVAPTKSVEGVQQRTQSASRVRRRWEMRLLFVDEEVILTFLGRLLATGLRTRLLESPAINPVKAEIGKARIPADLNMSLLAAGLLEASESLIPEVGKEPEPYLDQPTRLEGIVTEVESGYGRRNSSARRDRTTISTDLSLRIRSSDGMGMLLRLNNARSRGWQRADLMGAHIQAIGLLCRPRYRHVIAAAVMQLDGPDVNAKRQAPRPDPPSVLAAGVDDCPEINVSPSVGCTTAATSLAA
jgi:hypothetical protein